MHQHTARTERPESRNHHITDSIQRFLCDSFQIRFIERISPSWTMQSAMSIDLATDHVPMRIRSTCWGSSSSSFRCVALTLAASSDDGHPVDDPVLLVGKSSRLLLLASRALCAEENDPLTGSRRFPLLEDCADAPAGCKKAPLCIMAS